MQERLNKLIAQAGIASRRRADELIASGMVSVNGKVVTELGAKADPEIDHIKLNGKLINDKLGETQKVYILLNKPKGYLSSVADPEGRLLVTDLVPKKLGKLYPVGRLDFNTEGLLILTNDGEFTNLVASSKKIPKVYEVKVKGLPNANAINKLRRGITLEDGYKTAPADIKDLKPTDSNAWYEVTLHEGHNQQIRKMFDSVGHSVVKLRRLSIGHVRDEKIPIGAYRELSPQEIKQFIKPTLKLPKIAGDLKDAKKADEEPKLRPNSRAVKPKKPKNPRISKNEAKARAAKLAKPAKNIKEVLRGNFPDYVDAPKASRTRTETTPTRFKKPAPEATTSGLSKFRNPAPKRPKR